MKVDLINHMGSDLEVVNAARVSFDKQSRWVYCEETNGLDKGLSGDDKKLISYLAKHKHWSPFSHCFAKFRIKAPIFVARQLQKHVVGLAWNEVSRRYVDSEPEFYVPKVWRKRAENVKQGSSDEAVTLPHPMDCNYYLPKEIYEESLTTYNELLKAGVAPEQARMVLPQATMTEWIWSGSLYAFARVCKQRLDSHAQAETREIAEHISAHMQTIYPVSWKALLNG